MSASPSMQPSMVHILEIVFALPPDTALHRAMEGNMYTTPENFIMKTDETIDNFIFKRDDKKCQVNKSRNRFIENLQTVCNPSTVTRDAFWPQ